MSLTTTDEERGLLGTHSRVTGTFLWSLFSMTTCNLMSILNVCYCTVSIREKEAANAGVEDIPSKGSIEGVRR